MAQLCVSIQSLCELVPFLLLQGSKSLSRPFFGHILQLLQVTLHGSKRVMAAPFQVSSLLKETLKLLLEPQDWSHRPLQILCTLTYFAFELKAVKLIFFEDGCFSLFRLEALGQTNPAELYKNSRHFFRHRSQDLNFVHQTSSP